jgi:hypothetical protein
VLHDGGGDRSQTVAALSIILDGIRARGYVPAPLCASRPKLAAAQAAPTVTRRRASRGTTLDVVSAVRAALSGRATGFSNGRDGTVEAIRTLTVTKQSYGDPFPGAPPMTPWPSLEDAGRPRRGISGNR